MIVSVASSRARPNQPEIDCLIRYPLHVGKWIEIASGDVRLAARRFAGSGEGLLLLHGLAGHSGEWSEVAKLISSCDVFGLDLRGHGRSDRRPFDLSPQACCSDVVEVIKAMGQERVHLVGQSFGGHLAFLVAAWRPELVSSLVVIEADPDGPDPDAHDRAASWLHSWPRPFPDRRAALDFFGPSTTGRAWVAGLEERSGELWPRFDADIVLKALDGVTVQSWWDDWARITCPTWVVRGDRGALPLECADRMAAKLPDASVVTVPDAGHEVHLDQPTRLSHVLRQTSGSLD